MKKRTPQPKPLWNELYQLLIEKWRKIHKLPIGPEDKLQTREFRSLIQDIETYRKNKEIESVKDLGAYMMYDWSLHYAQGLSLIQELPTKPQKVLDLGTIAAPFSLAALQHGATEVLAIGENERALRLGAELSGHLGYPISIETRDLSSINPLHFSSGWDLIILPYALFKQFNDNETRVSYIQQLLPLLNQEGHILIVESSETKVNKEFLHLRDLLSEQEVPILAPCLWSGRCPALRHGSSPCFAQRPLIDKPFMIKEIQRAAKINLNSLKMSYMILSSPRAEKRQLADNLYRIVSPAVQTQRGTRYFLCGVSGSGTLGTTLEEHPKHSKAFEYLKRGDVVSIEDAVCLGDDKQVTDKTQLQLKAPCDKPLL